MTNVLAKLTAAIIAHVEANDAATEARCKELEALGHRIVDGGQTGPGSWEYTDYRTGEVLASSARGDDIDLVEESWNANKWWHIDPITEDTWNLDLPTVEGIPASIAEPIAETIEMWVENNEDEAKAWVAAQLGPTTDKDHLTYGERNFGIDDA